MPVATRLSAKRARERVERFIEAAESSENLWLHNEQSMSLRTVCAALERYERREKVARS
jgi:hypothetical protein